MKHTARQLMSWADKKVGSVKASLECTMAWQCAKIAWLREGDANTTFFHQHASYRMQKNVIHSLQDDGVVVVDHAAMAETTFDHFQA
jgi:hypothetical protein